MISICIPTYNRLPIIKQCLDQIFDGFKDVSYELIIADGGSTDGTLEYLRELDNIKLIEMGELTGTVKAFNACFKIAKGDCIIPLGDEQVVFPEVLIKGCELMRREKQIGVVSPKIICEKNKLHSVVRWIKRYGLFLSLHSIIRHSVLKEMGYWDERYRTYFADPDVVLSVLSLGYTSVVTREIGTVLMENESPDTKAHIISMKQHGTDTEKGFEKWKAFELKKAPQKQMFFNRCCSILYDTKHLWSFTRVYDWLLEKTVVFPDKDYEHLEDFFLAQKYPDYMLKRKIH